MSVVAPSGVVPAKKLSNARVGRLRIVEDPGPPGVKRLGDIGDHEGDPGALHAGEMGGGAPIEPEAGLRGISRA